MTSPIFPRVNTMEQFKISGTNKEGNSRYTVNIGCVSLHFSYATLVGVSVWDDLWAERGGGVSYRVENTWGRTTGRHMNEMGLEHAKVVTENELCEIVRGALFADVVHAPLNQGERV